MKRRGFTLVEALVVVAIVMILAAILFPIFARKREPIRIRCQSNLKQIGLAMLQYVQDNNERFVPLALNQATSQTIPFSKPYGWADGIYPYLKDARIYQCHLETQANASNDPMQRDFTDYWMNANVSRRSQIDLQKPERTILCGDGNDGSDATNARYNLLKIPNYWRTDQNAPSQRHFGKANYLFADGHVKALKVEQISDKSPKISQYTFAPH